MKIATWNVNSGAIADRLSELRTHYDADIVAMQETAEPTSSSEPLEQCFWAGDLKRKGLSVSSDLACIRTDRIGDSSPAIALQFTDSPLGPFNLLALWAKPTPSYFADLSRTLDQYATFIRAQPTVILGDFNMSVRIQQKGRQFYLLNARLNHDFDAHSAYHEFNNERFGMESMTTLYHQWGTAGCFHCDFVYVPACWLSRLNGVTIPGYNKFSTSDHRPVVCEFI
jgi:endonuclease/exonuclease/phosphatase family metal-dependent hydrolase